MCYLVNTAVYNCNCNNFCFDVKNKILLELDPTLSAGALSFRLLENLGITVERFEVNPVYLPSSADVL